MLAVFGVKEYNLTVMKSFIRDTAVTLGIALVIFFLLHSAVKNCIVLGPSMEPTLYQQERLLVSKLAYSFDTEPERGDIIVFQPPYEKDIDYIKRIIGCPGDTVEVKDGKVYVNDKVLEEPYVNEEPRYDMIAKKISTGEYFVLGDNRNNSNDSHNGWTVPEENIEGKAWLLIWPPNVWGLADNYSLETQLIMASDE